MPYRNPWRSVGKFLISVTVIGLGSQGQAQITLDGTLGPKGALAGPDFVIGADQGLQRGGNLFHSFGQFNVHRGESATFTGPDSVANILGRVTGGEVSSIDGLLRSTIPNANLYLMNPAGMVFGAHAQLDVQGSFHATTADFIRLEDGVRFTALPSSEDAAVLTVAPPAAFGFLGNKPGEITVEGAFLEVPAGEALSLIGGELRLRDGHLRAAGGTVNLISVASEGELLTDPAAPGAAFDQESFAALGRLTISRTSASPQEPADIDVSADTGGRVFIRGGAFILDNAVIAADTRSGAGRGIDIAIRDEAVIANAGGIRTVTSGSGRGGELTLAAGTLRLRDSATLTTRAEGSGAGGDLRVEAGTLTLQDRARITTATVALGQGGDIDILAHALFVSTTATTEATFAGLYSTTEGQAAGSGAGGAIRISADTLEVRDSAQIFTETRGSGKGGDITVAATQLRVADANPSGFPAALFAEVAPGSPGDGGDVTIDTGTLTVRDGAQVGTVTHGPGDGGNLAISAESVLISGGPTAQGFPTGIAAAAEGVFSDGEFVAASGDAGNITLGADTLEIRDGAGIDAFTLGSGAGGNVDIVAEHVLVSGSSNPIAGIVSASGGIFSDGKILAGGGAAGNITLNTDTLELRDGGVIDSSTYGSGKGGGHVDIAAEHILVSGSGSVIASVSGGFFLDGEFVAGSGEAGNITLAADTLELRDGGFITSSTFGSGKGGNVDIVAEHILVSGSSIFSISGGVFSDGEFVVASGDAGNITLNTDTLKVQDGGVISSATFGSGKGGQVDIVAEHVLISGSRISSSNGGFVSDEEFVGGTGEAGNITLDTDTLALRDGGVISSRTFGSGKGGQVDIVAEQILVSESSIFSASGGVFPDVGLVAGSGAAGNITLNTDTLELRDGGVISSGTLGSGKGGNVDIVAEQVLVSGTRTDASGLVFPSAIDTSAGANRADVGIVPGGGGAAGDITIETGTLEVRDGAEIAARTWGPGQGGGITVDVKGSILIAGAGGLFADTRGSGNGGDIQLRGETIALREGGLIAASSRGEGDASAAFGNAGNVLIQANDTFLAQDSSVTTAAAQAAGGNIEINAPRVQLIESPITASVTRGEGGGGNVTFHAQSLVALGNSDITARADQGFGGAITLNAEVFLRAPAVDLNASSNVIGNEGDIIVNAPRLDLSTVLVTLPTDFIDASAQLSQRCGAVEAETRSSFIARGRGGLPPEPEGFLPADYAGDGLLARSGGTHRGQGAELTLTRLPLPAEPALLAGLALGCAP